jgi:hypothetical protein
MQPWEHERIQLERLERNEIYALTRFVTPGVDQKPKYSNQHE